MSRAIGSSGPPPRIVLSPADNDAIRTGSGCAVPPAALVGQVGEPWREAAIQHREYTTTATAWGGRMGRVATSDGRLDYHLSLPEGMGGQGGDSTNPEQLFACCSAA
ncbi:MAG TPA: hypothetical protein VIU11_16960 [Nakamurella sp.]